MERALAVPTRAAARWAALAAAAFALAGGALLWRMRQPVAAGPLPVYGAVPAFDLVNQDGRRVSRDDLRGRVWIADFIFTRCAGQCPMMTGRMAELAKGLASVPGIRYVSLTVDPEWDTPAVLRRYADQSARGFDGWQFLTGDAASIRALCRDGFKLAVAAGGDPKEPITHSSRFVLVDAEGLIRGYYDASEPAALERLAADARRIRRPAR